ncbi:MAG: NrsF family protein [Polymorphobacter sp.]
MPTEFAPADPLIDALIADLGPVKPRRWTHEAGLLLGLMLAELLLFVMLRDMRPDMPEAMMAPAFMWKTGSLALVALLGGAAVLVSLDPATTTPHRLSALWRALGFAAPAALALGWAIDAGASGGTALLARLDWRDGVDCLVNVALLSLPMVLALGVLMRRGAPTQPARTAAAAGLAAAGFGAFVFAFHCNHDDPFYVAVWYGGAVAAVATLARIILPRFARW